MQRTAGGDRQPGGRRRRVGAVSSPPPSRRLGAPVHLSGMAARPRLGDDVGLRSGTTCAPRRAAGATCCAARRRAVRLPPDYWQARAPLAQRSIAANRSRRDAALNRRPNVSRDRRRRRFIVALAAAVVRPRAAAGGSPRSRRATATQRPRSTPRPPRNEHVNPVAFFRAMEQTAGEHAVFVADGRTSSPPRQKYPVIRARRAVASTRRVRHAGRRRRLRPRRRGGTPGRRTSTRLGRRRVGLRPVGVRLLRAPPHPGDRGRRHDAGWTQNRARAGQDVRRRRRLSSSRAHRVPHEVARGFGAEGIEIRRDDGSPPPAWRGRARSPPQAAGAGQRLAREDDFREGSISM